MCPCSGRLFINISVVYSSMYSSKCQYYNRQSVLFWLSVCSSVYKCSTCQPFRSLIGQFIYSQFQPQICRLLLALLVFSLKSWCTIPFALHVASSWLHVYLLTDRCWTVLNQKVMIDRSLLDSPESENHDWPNDARQSWIRKIKSTEWPIDAWQSWIR